MIRAVAASSKSYKVREFAALGGVTIKTLHHYDRLGLLKPRRTARSYRVYSDSDLPRLQQILVLKFIGLPLTDIAAALRSETRLREILDHHRTTVAIKRARLAVSLDILKQLAGARRNWADLAGFIRDVRIADPEQAWSRHRLDAAWRKIIERRLEWNATLQDYELSRDVRAAIERGETPETPAGQALIARWRDSIDRFIAGDADLREALELVMKDRANLPRAPWAASYRAYFARALGRAS